MLAAERGAGANTLAAYGRDLADFSRLPHSVRGGPSPRRATEDLRGLSRRAFAARLAARRPWRGGFRRSASSTGSSMRKASAATIPPPCSKVRSARARCRRRSRSRKSIVCCATAARSRSGGAVARCGCARRGSPASSRCSTPRACASPNSSRCRSSAARRDARVIVVRGKGNKERLVPLNDAAKRAMADYLALLAQSGTRGPIEMAVPVVRRERPSHAPTSGARTEGAGRGRGTARRASQPARAAPRFRQPPPAQWRRPARGADAARPRRHFHDADLYPRAGRAAEKPGARFAPAGAGII